MRIRSIRPEFWSSFDVAAMDWHTRLVFIGLWSYVDDNGVGRDDVRLIRSDLFPLDEDVTECSGRVTGALSHLSEHGQIVRYEIDGRQFLYIAAWERHQRIEKRSAGRYPLPTSGNASTTGALREGSGRAPEKSPLGEGEKGRRGEGEKGRSKDSAARSARSSDPDPLAAEFEAFWTAYPRKAGKPKARTAYVKARQRAEAATIRRGVDVHRPAWLAGESRFIPHPATWLNRDGWDDDPPPPPDNRSQRQREIDAMTAEWSARSEAERAPSGHRQIGA